MHTFIGLILGGGDIVAGVSVLRRLVERKPVQYQQRTFPSRTCHDILAQRQVPIGGEKHFVASKRSQSSSGWWLAATSGYWPWAL
jgi:hypothetical protein